MIGMEACSSARHRARELTRLGHEVRLGTFMLVRMAPGVSITVV
jgi:hypothetical protein